MAFNTFTAGMKLTPARLNATQVAYKSSNTFRSSTTTLTADPDLTLAVVANATYIMEARIVAVSTSATPDITVGFSGPSGATMDRWSMMWNDATTTVAAVTLADITTTRNNALSANLSQEHRMSGMLVTSSTAGNFAFQWAQGTSDATSTIVRAGSWLRLTRVA